MVDRELDDALRLEIEAATFRKLLKHLDENKNVQNIDLMNLANFCRNCLSKWYVAEARTRGLNIEYDDARKMVYGMPYSEWKSQFQAEASSDQLQKFNDRPAE